MLWASCQKDPEGQSDTQGHWERTVGVGTVGTEQTPTLTLLTHPSTDLGTEIRADSPKVEAFRVIPS